MKVCSKEPGAAFRRKYLAQRQSRVSSGWLCPVAYTVKRSQSRTHMCRFAVCSEYERWRGITDESLLNW
jgi:hypothetical protein